MIIQHYKGIFLVESERGYHASRVCGSKDVPSFWSLSFIVLSVEVGAMNTAFFRLCERYVVLGHVEHVVLASLYKLCIVVITMS